MFSSVCWDVGRPERENEAKNVQNIHHLNVVSKHSRKRCGGSWDYVLVQGHYGITGILLISLPETGFLYVKKWLEAQINEFYLVFSH